jgi:RNA polymerase sigma factor (sigma-70 family)
VAITSTPFEGYVRARTDALVGLAVLITRNWADAQDAVQDALAALYPRWHALPPAEELDRYVNRAVVNACLKQLRRSRRTVPVAEVEWLPLPDEPADPTAETVLAREAWSLCSRLRPVQRAAVALRFSQDLSYAEIAAILGCGEATARSHVRRAVTALRVASKEVPGDD